MKVHLYIVAASPNPDAVECSVPYRVDDKEIFFGPCKKRLREELRQDYLKAHLEEAVPKDGVFVVGFNGGNRARTRKVVWAGRVTTVMTFARAWDTLTAPRYQKMREWRVSPLHLKPLRDANALLVGYEHVGEMHRKNDDWVLDVVTSRGSPHVRLDGRQLLLGPGATAWAALPRDVCVRLDNRFFADGEGLPVDAYALDILRRAQPGKVVDGYAVFGYRADGTADGRTGSYLTLEGSLAEEFVAWISGTEPAPVAFVPTGRKRAC